MPAAPKKDPSLSRLAPKLVTLVGAVDGSAPTAADEVDWLHPVKIERRIGGSQVSAITFRYDLGITQEKLVDTLTPKGITRQIEVREINKEGTAKRLLMWGKLASQPIEIDADSHTVSYVVRIDKHLLGGPLIRTPFWNPVSSAVADLDRPLIFNPEIDEIVQRNCSDLVDAARGNALCFYDAAGVDTAAARTTHGQVLTKWRIYEAAHRLCWLLNPAETFVLNPTFDELAAALGPLDGVGATDKLKNRAMTQGRHLPELLDELLVPYGAAWYIALEINDAGESVRRIKCFIRSAGPVKELFLQRSGPLETAKTSLAKMSLNFDIANLHNKIIGSTSRIQREGTFYLYKCWPESEDGFSLAELTTDKDIQQAHPHAGRMWVLNESGAYTGLRTYITGYTDLSGFFTAATLPICRSFLPCLSRVPNAAGDALESRGIVVEYSIDGGITWNPVSALTNGSFSNLLTQCGIWFETIPTEIWNGIASPGNIKIRVTATIEGDRRTQATATRRASSPNADDVSLFLNLEDKFHNRAVDDTSIFFGDGTADEADDSAELQTYVDQVRDIEDAAEASCSAQIEGIDHPEYELGDLINRVNGLNISLIRDNPAVGTAGKCLQIVGITLDIQAQRTELLLETFDEEKLS